MNTKVQHYFLLCLITLLVSCSAPKEVLYLQDIATIKEENIDPKIRKQSQWQSQLQ